MSKLASKLSRRIMAALLSVAMIMPNMTVYASENSDSDAILQTSGAEDDTETVENSDPEENIAGTPELSLSEDEISEDKNETVDPEEGASEEQWIPDTGMQLSEEWVEDDSDIINAISPQSSGYTITVDTEVESDTDTGVTGGTARASAESAAEGETVTLTATPAEGYMLKEWKINTGEVDGVTYVDIAQFGIKSSEEGAKRTDKDMFIMPAGDVSITAIFKQLSDNYEWNLATLTSASNFATIQTKTGYIDGLRIDATNGKVGANDTSWAQVNPGTIIQVPVNGASNVTVKAYEAASYKVDGITSTATKEGTQTFACSGTNGLVEIEMLSLSNPNQANYLATIKVEKIPESDVLYPVAINVVDKTTTSGSTLTSHDLAGLEIKYTESGQEETYVIDDEDEFKLKAGTYSVSIGTNNSYIQDSGATFACDNSSLNVTGTNDALTINVTGYDSTKDITEWKFNEGKTSDFETQYPTGDGKTLYNGWYKGLKLSQVRSHGPGQYAYMANGSKISIPVKGKCNISVTTDYSAAGTIGNLSLENSGTVTYPYTKDEAGYVDIATTGTSYLTNIKITEADSDTYTVTLKPTGAGITVEDLRGAEIVFTDEEGTEKSTTIAADATAIEVEGIGVGTYTVDVYKSGVFVQQNTDAELTVTGNCEHEITFKSYITEWDFSDSKFQSDRYNNGNYTWYNGLELTAVYSRNGKYAYLYPGSASSKIEIPVKQACEITVDYYEQQAENTEIATLGEADAENPTKIIGKSTNGDFTTTYKYSGDEEGTVLLSAKTDFYVSKITIKYQENTHTVTVKPTEGENVLTDADLKGSVITFTDVGDADNKYSFTIGDGDDEVALNAIELNEGTYSVSVYNSNVYVQKTTDDIEVNADNITCVIPFDSYITTWNFSADYFKNNYTQAAGLTWYNGLEIIGGYAHNGKYLYIGNGHKVRIPVKGDCDIKVSYYPDPQATIGKTKDDEGEALEAGEDEPVYQTYKYTGEKGYVDIDATGTTYLIGLTINYPNDGSNDGDDTATYTDGIDVWDFGAEQLDSSIYNNLLTEDILNSAYPSSVTAGSSGKEGFGSFEITDANGNVDFRFVDGGKTNHRLRTKNTNLTRYDEKDITLDGTTYKGYLYSNSSANSAVYLEVRLNAGDIMTAVVSSNGGDYTITVEDPNGSKQNFARTYSDSAKASLITYYAATSGMYKIYNGIDEKLVVARVTRQHSKSVKVSGNVTIPADATEDLTLEFTCRESGAVKEVQVANGSYEVNLFENYNYDVVVYPTKYVIESGEELKLGAANDTQTATHDIKVTTVLLRTLSGSIVGLDDDAMNALEISFKKPEDKLYTPVITIDRTAKTYTVELESGVEYTMITEGINDYELNNNASNNSDRIKINSDTMGRNITYVKKTVYKVTINPEGATLADLADATFTFTNINEEGYVYTFTGPNDIELRDGTYSVVVSNSGIYIQQLTSNLVIDGADVTKKIVFNSDITKWIFSAAEGFTSDVCNAGNYKNLKLTGVSAESGKAHAVLEAGSKIEIPVKGNCIVEVTYYYAANGVVGDTPFEAHEGASLGSTSKTETATYSYTGSAGYVELTTSAKTYLTMIELKTTIPYQSSITVNPSQAESDSNYTTINDALEAVRNMERTSSQLVTINIAPGDYEEMLVIDVDNIKLVNASSTPSIELRNQGVDIDSNAVRITSYYGHGYTYYSMGSDCKWNEEILEINKANGYPSYINPGSGTTDGSYWNATVVINASNVSAEGIIFENSFNQYISKKAAEDIIVAQGGAKEGSVPRASMAAGDTTVQQKEYVERAAALAIYDNCAQIAFDNCKFIGRQDTLYGGTGVTAAFYDCSIYGGTDYIFGAMTAVFAKCDLVFNTNEGNNNDVGYITAAQQKSGRGYLMWNCHVTSTIPGVDTASKYTSKPGYFGRPWQANTGEAVFYYTIIDEADAYWQSPKGTPTSLILPAGWGSGLSGESVYSQEYGTYEVSGVDNNKYQELDEDGKVKIPGRVKWSSLLDDANLVDETPITVASFLGSWDPFADKNMEIVLPSDTDISAPAAPKAIVTPAVNDNNEVIKGAKIVLAAETGAKVYYNINSDDIPTVDSTLYTGEIEVNDNIIQNNSITIKAIAVKYGKTSEPLSVTYTVIEATTPNKPEFTPAEGDIKLGSRIIMSADSGAAIYYNVNSSADPDDKATLYTGKSGIEITNDMINASDSTVTIKAVAILYGKTSDVTEVTYNVIVNAPTADPKSGYQFPDGGGKVKLTADEGVEILYTIGDEPEDPNADGITPETYDKNGDGITVSSDTTIKAVAKRGTKYSNVVTLNYIVPLSMPKATPESGAVLPKNARTVILTADAGATIYYTMGAEPDDPSDDTSNRETYTDAGITVTEDTTIKAVAEKGERCSTVAIFTYTVSDEEFAQAETPTAKVNDKLVSNTIEVEKDTDVVVKLESETEGAVIHYTLDGSVPTVSSDRYNNETGITIHNINKTTVVKAVATKDDMLNSDILTITITVKDGNGDTGDDQSGLIIKFVNGTSYPYTGAAIKPEIEVRNNGKLLVLGTDYTVKYSNNTKVSAGLADNKKPKVTITGKGNLTGSTYAYFDITTANIDDAVAGRIVVVKNKKLPVPSIYYNGVKLANNKDFTYDNTAMTNVTEDPANPTKLTITGAGNFAGSTTPVDVIVVENAAAAKAYINKFTVSVDKNKTKLLVYDGNRDLKDDIKDAITVTSKATNTTTGEFVVDKAYTYSFPKDLTNAGTVKVTIVGIGDYSGCNVTKSFKILPKTITSENVVDDETKALADGQVMIKGTSTPAVFSSTGAAFEDMSLVYGHENEDGEIEEIPMKLGVDYKIAYSGNKKAADGKAKYTITFMGNYKGKYTSGKFDIVKAPLDSSTAQVVVLDKVSKKEGVVKSTPYVTISGVTLKSSEYTVEYYTDSDCSKPMDKNNPVKFEEGKGYGTVYVKIVPKENGNYELPTNSTAATGSYKVWETPADATTNLTKAKITFLDESGAKATKVGYTGNPVAPATIKVDIGGKTITIDTTDEEIFNKEKQSFTCDGITGYIVNNVNKGKATVVINGEVKEDGSYSYAGGKTATFSIVSQSIKDHPILSAVTSAADALSNLISK